MKRLLSFPPISFTLEAFSTYGRCGVAQAAAALSYFLILTLFPLLMCVNYFIGLFHLSLEQLLSGLDQVLPDQALAVMQDYLAYASLNQSPAIVAAALVAIALSASAGLRALLLAMDKLYGLEHPGGLRRIALSVILSLLFLLTIYLSVVVIFTGDWFFHLLETHLPHPLLRLIPLSALSSLWLWIRYLLLLSLRLTQYFHLFHHILPTCLLPLQILIMRSQVSFSFSFSSVILMVNMLLVVAFVILFR